MTDPILPPYRVQHSKGKPGRSICTLDGRVIANVLPLVTDGTHRAKATAELIVNACNAPEPVICQACYYVRPATAAVCPACADLALQLLRRMRREYGNMTTVCGMTLVDVDNFLRNHPDGN